MNSDYKIDGQAAGGKITEIQIVSAHFVCSILGVGAIQGPGWWGSDGARLVGNEIKFISSGWVGKTGGDAR